MKKILIKKLVFDGGCNLFATSDKNFQNNNKKVETKEIDKNIEEEDFDFKYSNDNIYYKSEIALWKAVILQALVDLQSNSKKKIANTYRIKALMWFNLKNEDFLQVCEYAGLDPNYVYEKSRIVKNKSKFFQ